MWTSCMKREIVSGCYLYRIYKFGVSLNQPMKPCLLGPPILSLGKRSGRVGLQGSANSSCGPQLTIDVGQLTD